MKTDTTAIEKVIAIKAAEQLNADMAEFKAAIENTKLGQMLKRYDMNFVDEKPPYLNYEYLNKDYGDRKMQSFASFYKLCTDISSSGYLHVAKPQLLQMYKQTVAATLMKKFEQLTDIL